MEVQVRKAGIWDEPTFRNLFQFYIYEFSRFTFWNVSYAGRFPELDVDGCWTDDKRQPFLIRVDGELAGLAIVDERDISTLSGEANVRELSEFFILAAYQRRGVGIRAARLLFDRFPGKWQLRQMAQNADALAFWRVVLQAHVPNQWREQVFDNDVWRGTVHFFDNSPSL